MDLTLQPTRFRRLALAAIAAVLALIGAVLAPGLAEPAHAAPAAQPYDGWTMLVNDGYDGYNGQMWCLSTNTQSAGGNTHIAYLSVCNPNTPAQWWDISHLTESLLRSYQNFGGDHWELSANLTTPPGGTAGTYGAFTAIGNGAPAHRWAFLPLGSNRYTVRNGSGGTGMELSATSNNPYSGGVLRVFTAVPNGTPPHVWRLYNAPGTSSVVPPHCTPCG